MSNKKISPAIRQTLLKLATGYEVEEKEVLAGKSGKAEKVRVTKKHIPPDMKAIEKIERYKRMGLWED